MKIGIEVQRLLRKKRFGIEASSLELIKALQTLNSGFKFVVFAKDDVNRQGVRSANMDVRPVSGKMFIDFEQLFLPLAARRERVDVLHCTGNTTPILCPVPIIQTLHDVIFMDPIPRGDSLYQRFGNLYRRTVVPFVTPRSDAVITVSEYEKQRILRRIKMDPDRIHVVYNGIDLRRFHSRHMSERQEDVRTKYQLPGKFILFLGNQATRKNALRVIEAYVRYAARAPEVLPLVTPGLSPTFIDQQLERLNSKATVGQFLTPGYIHDNDLPVLYQLSTLFLFPSLSEGFGMPLIEAMACGTPVITSNLSSMPEIAGKAAHLVNPWEVEDITDAMLRLTTDSSLRNRLREAGFTNIRRFSWESAARTILKLYEKVYAENRNGKKATGWMSRSPGHAVSARYWK